MMKSQGPTERGALLARAPRAAPVALGLIQVVALFWFRAGANGFPRDDAWIHQVVARTFASSGTLGYAPGHHGAGATSYLWALALGVNSKWLHVDPVRWSFALNAILAVATGQLLYAVFVRARPRGVGEVAWRGASLAAAAFACISGNFLWFSHSGMEVNLFVALSLVAIWAATHEQAGPRYALVAGTAAGLVALVRPEGALLGAILFAYPIGGKRAWPTRAALAVPWLVAVAGYALVNLANTGHVAPATFAGRRWLWFDASQGQSHADLIATFLGVWATRLRKFVLETGPVVSWIALGLAAYGAVRLVRLRNHGLRLLFVWGAAHTALYAVLLPAAGHGGRYQPFVPMLFTACLSVGAALVAWDLTRSLARGARLDVLAVSVIVWLPALYTGASAMKRANELAIAHIDATELGAGTFVRGLPPGARVASFDIGGIGWAADRGVVDLGGLGDPAVAAQVQDGRAWQVLAAEKIAFVILPEEYAPQRLGEGDFRGRLGLRDNPAVTLSPIFQLATPMARWAPAIDATQNASAVQVVYAVELTGAQGPRTVPPPPASKRRPIHDPSGLLWAPDRAVAEHMLAVLEAWGLPVDIRVTGLKIEQTNRDETGCEIVFGPAGLSVEGCAALGEHRAALGAVFEAALPYLDANDYGGAARAAVRAVARAKQRLDATFFPMLAPIVAPRLDGGDSQASRTAGWGIPLLVGVFVAAWGLRFARVLRRRFTAVIALSLSLAGCQGANALPRAAAEGQDEVVTALSRGAPVEGRDHAGRTALLVAAAQGDADTMKLLLARGASPEARTGDGTTALHLAARKACTPCARLVAAAMAERDAEAGPRRRTAMHDAVLTDDDAIVSALLASGVDSTKRDSFGATPLHLLAGARRSATLATLLLAGGADWRTADGRGFTAMHAAAAADDAPLLRAILVMAAGEIDEANPRGETALDVAQRYHADRAAEVLLGAGAAAHAPPPLHEAARMDDLERATSLVAFGVDLARRFEGKTVAEVAREHHNERVLARVTKSP